ncbi:hypothetical protein RUM43_011406 [Polyplax serrata]|uniref:Uncharacterized protein n=1 Tax=Polyplax serrata TaxID=468196 RepID=A0AAN8NM52_POLSC
MAGDDVEGQRILHTLLSHGYQHQTPGIRHDMANIDFVVSLLRKTTTGVNRSPDIDNKTFPMSIDECRFKSINPLLPSQTTH